MRQALERLPADGNRWGQLGRQFMDAGQPEDAAQAFREAIIRLPDDPRLRLDLAGPLIRLDRFDEALDAVRASLKLAPGARAARILEFDILVRIGHTELALSMADEIAAIDPANPMLLRLWRDTANGAAELEMLLQHCDAILSRMPGNTAAMYHKVVTLMRLGRDDEARVVMRFESLVAISELPVPDDYPDRGAFCDALADELRSNPTFIRDARGRISENVDVSVNVNLPLDRAVPALTRQIQRAVDDYAARVQESDLPWAKAQPAKAWLHAWGVIHRAQGRLKTHFHDGAWISGVFYVEAPRREGGIYCGPLLLGTLDERLAPRTVPPWPIVNVEPVPGRLVLFPSYVPHSTEPGLVDGDRISVSFDVLPVAGSA